jgi:ATP-binding cassette subfamily B multidrug efflux pump
LSAGQRQLIALTRAMVHEPAVLLLDEATASIDGASDAALRAALRRLVTETGTGVLTVAHRLATARQADRIIVLDAGTVVEQGPPDDLLAAGGRFADLATLDLATPDGEVAAEHARTRGR